MRFSSIFIAAAIVAQFFDKIAVFAKPFLGLDVMTISIEYGYKGTENWRRSFLECLNDAFHFGTVDYADCRFAFGCSYAIMNDDGDLKYIKRLDRNPPTVDTTSCGCQSYRHENKIEDVLFAAAHVFQPGRRNYMSVVTIIFADETLNYDISSFFAKQFVDWPHQLYLAIENSTADTSNLKKQGFDISHVLKFTMDECPPLVSQLQHLLCRGAPKLGTCEHTTSDPSVCKAALESYNLTLLGNAALVCHEVLVPTQDEKGEKFDCVCPTSVLSTVTSDVNTSDTAAVKKQEDDGLSSGLIALIVVGVIFVLLAIVAGCVWWCVFRRSGGSAETVGAKGASRAARARAAGSLWSPLRRIEGRASPKSVSKKQTPVSKLQKSVSKSPISALKLQKSAPKSPISVSKPHKSVSKKQTPVSKLQKSVSKSPISALKLQKSAPKSPISVSKPHISVSKKQTPVSKLQKAVSKSPISVLKLQKSVQKSPISASKPHKSVSKKQTPVSKLQKAVSKSPISILKPQESVSKQQQSVSQPPKSVLKQPKKSKRSTVRGGQSKTGGSKMAKSGMGKT